MWKSWGTVSQARLDDIEHLTAQRQCQRRQVRPTTVVVKIPYIGFIEGDIKSLLKASDGFASKFAFFRKYSILIETITEIRMDNIAVRLQQARSQLTYTRDLYPSIFSLKSA
jgi:hypothetical protein